MVRKQVWDAMSGYGGIFDRFTSAEEPYFGMRAWMMGFSSWLHPVPICWHQSRVAPWKERDEGFMQGYTKALKTLQNLKAKHTLEQAYEMVMAL